MLKDCDICAYLGECRKDLQKQQLISCLRYKFFLDDLNKAIESIPHSFNDSWAFQKGAGDAQ